MLGLGRFLNSPTILHPMSLSERVDDVYLSTEFTVLNLARDTDSVGIQVPLLVTELGSVNPFYS
jgi:hypothetical protein